MTIDPFRIETAERQQSATPMGTEAPGVGGLWGNLPIVIEAHEGISFYASYMDGFPGATAADDDVARAMDAVNSEFGGLLDRLAG